MAINTVPLRLLGVYCFSTVNSYVYPLLFEPLYKDYIWGGHRIPRQYNRAATPGNVAESWEVSDRPEGMSSVVNGSLAGSTLHELVQRLGPELLGRGRSCEAFPLLIKIIDAKERLSVQVHPDEESASSVGGEPKTEALIVLDANPGGVVYAGLKPGVDGSVFREALGALQVERLLQTVSVSLGDVIYIPGGRVHAIGEGCLLLEIQQNSNTTYRVYDWGRVGRDGKPRELHVEKAMRVIHWDDTGPAKVGGRGKTPAAGRPRREAGSAGNDKPKGKQGRIAELFSCPYFRIERMTFAEGLSCSMGGRSFHVLFVEQGQVRINTESSPVDVGPGTSVLMPANMGGYQLAGMNASHDVLRISLP